MKFVPKASRASWAARTASSASRTPEVLGSSWMPGRRTWASMSSSGLFMSMRFMATVTISVCEASMALAISSLELNLPVPTNRRERNVRPPITNSFFILRINVGFC